MAYPPHLMHVQHLRSQMGSGMTTGEDPRSERACDEMVEIEAKQDSREDPDSPIPDSDTGSEKAHDGSLEQWATVCSPTLTFFFLLYFIVAALKIISVASIQFVFWCR
jgi:hypothetical protein